MWRLHSIGDPKSESMSCAGFLRKKMCATQILTWMIIPLFCFIQGYSSSTCTWHLSFWNRFGLVQKRSQNAIDQRHLWDRHLLPAPQDGPAGADDASDLVAAYFGAFHQLESWTNRRVFVGRQNKKRCVWFLYTLLGKTRRFVVSGPISLVIFNWFN